MQRIIHINRLNSRNVFKILLICTFSVLLSVPAGKAGEYKGDGNKAGSDGNHLISFSRNMSKQQMILHYDDGDALSAPALSGKGELTHKISRLVNQCIRYFSCQGSRMKFNAFTLEAGHFDTSVNAVYNHDEKEVEIGMSSDSLNRRLGPGVDMELLTNPSESSAALMFSIKI